MLIFSVCETPERLHGSGNFYQSKQRQIEGLKFHNQSFELGKQNLLDLTFVYQQSDSRMKVSAAQGRSLWVGPVSRR